MIEVEQLALRFTQGRGRRAQTVHALAGLDLRAGDACITGLLGSNGAGKTTCLRVVAGLLRPDAGRVRVDGIDALGSPHMAQARMGVLSDARGLYPRLTARENIVYFARLQGLPDTLSAQRVQALADTLDMQALLDRRTEGFSQGERMKTALARALVHDPPNIILDEPTNGLDVVATRSLRAALRRLRDEQGKCIVFSTHIMQEVERLCDQVVVVAQGRTAAQGSVAELCARTATSDFEEAFVRLAIAPAADDSEPILNLAWTVFRKELLDALRDRRTLAMVLLSSVAVGPLVLVLLSVLVADIERRAEAREVTVHGIEHAPSLRNYFERQTYTVVEAPPDHARLLKDGKLGEPVLVVGAAFEDELARGDAPVVELLTSASNRRAQTSTGRILRLLRGFNQELGTLRLAVRGVPPSLLEAVQVEERDLADAAARAAQLAAIIPFFVLMAVLYGAMNAALDSTAGERERGSLEPLLVNPVPRTALVLGKWAAVAAVGMLIAVLSCFSFLPGQWLLRSETLAAMFRFGPREALLFLALLLPLAGALSGVLMAIAIRCRSFKEAQANATLVVLGVSLLPLMTVFNQEGEAPWHLWVPALAQITLMGRVLRGEGAGVFELLLPLAACALVAALCVAYVARALRTLALR